jgi:hypothetical protein
VTAAKQSLDDEGDRNRDNAAMLNAAGLLADHFQNDSDDDSDVNAGVEMFAGGEEDFIY